MGLPSSGLRPTILLLGKLLLFTSTPTTHASDLNSGAFYSYYFEIYLFIGKADL